MLLDGQSFQPHAMHSRMAPIGKMFYSGEETSVLAQAATQI